MPRRNVQNTEFERVRDDAAAAHGASLGAAAMPPERDPNSPTSTHVHEEGIDLDRPADRVGYESPYAAPRNDARERYVDTRPNVALEAVVLHVRHDPDHGEPRRLLALAHPLPNRISAVRPQRVRKSLVDDDDAGLVRAFAAVLISEHASALQPDAH